MSTKTVLSRKWHLALSAFRFTIMTGFALLILLALGLADPPRAGHLIWQANTARGWKLFRHTDEFDLYIAPLRLPQTPFTLELRAANQGHAASAWGIWLDTSEGVLTLLVSSEGYVSVSRDESAHWSEFIHVRSIANRLYLDARRDQSAAFLINDEIAWTGTVAATGDWGIALYQHPHLSWDTISLYATSEP